MKRPLLVLALYLLALAGAAAQTNVNWGLATGANPRNLCVYDSTHACVTTGTLDSTLHVFTPVGGGGSGTVTSVGLTMPPIFTVTGSPVTSTGTLAAAFASQSANLFLASPNGSAGVPAMRAITAQDLPASGVSAGSYTILNATIDAYGRITAAANGGGASVPLATTSAQGAMPALNGSALYFLNGLGAWAAQPTVSVINYGAVANSSTSYAVNETAFQNALATGLPVVCPSGSTFYTQAILIPTNAVSLSGACNLTAAGTYSGLNAVLVASGTTGLVLKDFTVYVSPSTYPAVDGIDLFNNTRVTVSGVQANGFDAINDINGVGDIIEKNNITNFINIGIVCSGCNNLLIDDNKVTTSQVGTYYDIQVVSSANATVSRNFVSNGGEFGISIAGSSAAGFAQTHNIIVSDNHTLNTIKEGINLANVGLFTVSGNEVSWNNGSSTDFGISAWGDPTTSPMGVTNLGTITGNSVYFSCKTGIALANNSSNITVSGNNIYNANACNGATPYHIAGILAYGGGALKNSISGNNIIDPSAHLTWAVNEYNDGSAGGSGPDFNRVGDNGGDNGTSGNVNLIGAHSSFGSRCWFTTGPAVCSGAVASLGSNIAVLAPSGVGGSGATNYFAVTASFSEATAALPISVGGKFRNAFFLLNTAPGGAATDTLTLRVNGASTAVTCTVTGAATSCSDTTHTAAIAAGQTYDVMIVGSTGAAATLVNGGVQFNQ